MPFEVHVLMLWNITLERENKNNSFTMKATAIATSGVYPNARQIRPRLLEGGADKAASAASQFRPVT